MAVGSTTLSRKFMAPLPSTKYPSCINALAAREESLTHMNL